MTLEPRRREERKSLTVRAAALLAIAALSGCGGAAAAPDADAVFRAIQVHEATVEHALLAAEACDPADDCPARDEICAAADEICALAATLEDADADARCGLARRRCGRPTHER